jgi:hypothetical protein
MSAVTTVPLATVSVLFSVIGKIAAENGQTFVSDLFNTQAGGIDALELAIEKHPVEAGLALTAGLTAAVLLGPEVAAAGYTATLGASLFAFAPALFSEATAATVAADLVDGLLVAGGSTLYGALRNSLGEIVDGLGGSVAQPTNLVTPDQAPPGNDLLLLAPNASPLILSFPDTGINNLAVSASGAVEIPVTSGSWASISADGSSVTIASTQQAIGALASVENTYDANGNLTQTQETFTNGKSVALDQHTETGLTYNASTNTRSSCTLYAASAQSIAGPAIRAHQVIAEKR